MVFKFHIHVNILNQTMIRNKSKDNNKWLKNFVIEKGKLLIKFKTIYLKNGIIL